MNDNISPENSALSVMQIAVDSIAPNPYQPRVDFNKQNLSSLAESIRQYGVMQPIVVTQKAENQYELISGERRLRASKLAGKQTIPAIVRQHEHSDEEKFELAIIENLQREDLNPIDKAKSFKKLVDEFNLTHSDIAQKMGKSREYISNSLRILLLPDYMLDAMVKEEITEGHARPLLMLKDRVFEQGELFKKIVSEKLTVRAAEKMARSVAIEKIRKPDSEEDSDLKVMETKLAEKLGTKVSIDKKTGGEGGRLTIEYFSKEDLEKIVNLVRGKGLSSASVLEERQVVEDMQSVETFNNNFDAQGVGKESLEDFSHTQPSVFGEEIESLQKNSEPNPEVKRMNAMGDITYQPAPMESKVRVEEPVSQQIRPEQESSFGGFNITSFDKTIPVEEVAQTSSMKEDISESVEAQAPGPLEKETISEKENEAASAPVEKKKYGNFFARFGEINNFGIPSKKKIGEEKEVEDVTEQVVTETPIPTESANTAPVENFAVGATEPTQPQVAPAISQEAVSTFGETQVIPERKVKETSIQASPDQITPTPTSTAPAEVVNMEEKIKEAQEAAAAVMGGKSEAQKRIDSILAGRSTVDSVYGTEPQNTGANATELDSLVSTPAAQNSPMEAIQEQGNAYQDSEVYQNFLESKKRIESQEMADQNFHKPSEEVVAVPEAEEDRKENFSGFSAETAEFMGAKGTAQTISESEKAEHLSGNLNKSKAAEMYRENIQEEQPVAMFSGNDFVPQGVSEASTEEVNENGKEEKTPTGSGFNFSI